MMMMMICQSLLW